MPTDKKLKAITDAPTPAYLWLLNFYHIFLKNKATVEPLLRLLMKGFLFIWMAATNSIGLGSSELLCHRQEIIRVHVKNLKDSVRFCTLPLWWRQTIMLTCDSSSYGIGVVLCQLDNEDNERPIAFYSRTLSSSERNFAQIDKEA